MVIDADPFDDDQIEGNINLLTLESPASAERKSARKTKVR